MNSSSIIVVLALGLIVTISVADGFYLFDDSIEDYNDNFDDGDFIVSKILKFPTSVQVSI